MKMTEWDCRVWELLKGDHNPMFGIAEIAKRLSENRWTGYESHHPYYSRARRTIAKFEDFGLLYVYRVVNGGTVVMLKTRAL